MKKIFLAIMVMFSVFIFLWSDIPANAEVVDSHKSEVRVGFYEGKPNSETNESLPKTGSENNVFIIIIGISIVILIGIMKLKTKEEEENG
ncbi:LPXTG cell wall anchor domain-containing protein [Carnobacterium divergens]|nr:LPXTG cell wall anchor domain-containing protein [Carnobacterium divergens]MDO0875392.1 LPXTG cell wall anchor domain-containing protein [Carnobacterium divergens]SUX16991.1 LPXTG cell wall anchor domain [Carnobacterium divergens]